MELYIDTTEHGKFRFKLLSGKRVLGTHEKNTEFISEHLLPELKKFLRENKVKLSDLQKIDVNPGPGAFSAVRTGVTVANALAFALGLRQKLVLPKYDKAPNITSPTSPHYFLLP